MSIGEKLTKIAENLTGVYGTGYIAGQSTGYETGYQQGKQDGSIAAREHCLMNHYAASVFGDGTGEFVHNIPFQPDIITVYTTHSYTSKMPNCYRGFTADLRACGRHMCNFYYTLAEGGYKSGWLVSDVSGKSISYNNGVLRFKIDNEQFEDVQWLPNIRYHIVAIRFPSETGKQLLEEQIMLLPDQVPEGTSGQLPYTKSVIDSYFTETEWERLISQKPNWEFVLK